MDLDTEDELLKALTDGESMNYEQWPGLLSRLIPRLEKIVHDEFPIPAAPSSQPSSSQIPSSPPTQPKKEEPSSQNSVDSNQYTDKENAPPPVVNSSPGALPSQIQTLLTSITTTLESLFSKHPPHTIQRLAELILTPKHHYRTLPSYLHAVDRVVHVTSGAHTFPLPPAIPEPSSATVLSNGTSDPLSISWGNPASTPQASLGPDESLGGALLTPIPWLAKNGGSNGTRSPLEGEVKTESTEMIEGPNGPGGIETVSVSINGISSATKEQTSTTSAETNGVAATLRAEGGVTQGELLRQEQRAGVVPATQLAGSRGDTDGMGEEDEVPHARGPEEIGMEDTGPQGAPTGSERSGPGVSRQGINVEAAVGRRVEVKDEDEKKVGEPEAPVTPKREADEELGADEKRIKEDTEDKEMVMVDADGKAEDEKEVGEEGENKGADAVDTTTV